MKNNEPILLTLVASLLLAINTEWSKPAKMLVIISAVVLALSAVKGLKKEIKKK